MGADDLDLDGLETPGADARDVAERARECFVDALLERAVGAGVDDRADVERALLNLDLGAARRAPVGRRRALVAAAVGLFASLVGTLALLLGPGATTARAALDQAIEVATRAEQRAYRITVERPSSLSPIFQADLFTNGGQRFALRLDAPLGGDLWCGGNRYGTWLVPALEALPVIESNHPSRLIELLAERGLALPYVDVLDALRVCSANFALDLDRDGQLLTGQRLAGTPPGPDRFELRLGDGGELLELTIERDATHELGGLRFALLQVPDDFDSARLDRRAHHAPGRAILQR